MYENSDEIKYLPSDKIKPSESELFIIKNLFQPDDDDKPNLGDKIINNIYEPIIISILFICFSCSSIDDFLKKLPYITTNSHLLFVKICLLMIVVFFIRFYANKKGFK
jgi:hypothetical protein